VIPFDLPPWLILPFLFLVGSCLGSFINVCVHRIPQHERLRDQLRALGGPPSRCPKCLHPIRTRDNIPLLGWLLLRGRCRYCRLRISVRYPLVELANGLLFVLVYLMQVPLDVRAGLEQSGLYASIGPQLSPAWSPVLHVNLRYLYTMVLLEALLVASLIDYDLKIIPDGSTVPAMFVGVAVAAASGHVHLLPVWFQDPSLAAEMARMLPDWVPFIGMKTTVPAWTVEFPRWHGLAVSLAGLLVGGGMTWIVRLLGQWILRREAMGFGDVILMALIGSFVGWQASVIIFLMAPICALLGVLGSLIFRRAREIPYGPFLSLSTLLTLLYFDRIWPFWGRIFSTGMMVPAMGLMGLVLMAISLHAIQAFKKLAGIPLHDEEGWIEEWTSADQLGYLDSENQDRHQGRWRTRDWPGVDAGRGTLHQEQWRHGSGDT
jgi:leader peptidase (prepilin peptidase) / N-methyltransferase